ncbi:hypothetical protein LTR37_000553 [Vermiconidia calcicola]|uniref:Uncharacterized protein n=1 Tax=Vermiconidia calcicola TaxID=1690605 RepID=A0ACC3NXY9_9PEZI|nr:hypothetical protein LTR37_000553 [Vermiconidia calcicola]
MMFFQLMLLAASANAYFPITDGFRPFGPGYNRGAYPQDFNVVGPELQAVHDSQDPPTGLAVDDGHNIYLTYPRNSGQTPVNVVKCTGFNEEQPWPNAAIQNCTEGQDPSTCFVNVQNVVLDSIGQMWVVDSGFPYDAEEGSNALVGGAKIMSFNQTTGEHIRTHVIPEQYLSHQMNPNDVRFNNTLGTNGYAFITDASTNSSILSVNLDDGSVIRRLFNTSVVRADDHYVSSCDGFLVYCWNKTDIGYCTTAADGIALASANFYWGVLSSRRFYYISQEVMIDASLSDEEVLAAVQNPGQCATEQAGFTADSKGRVYILASEQNAIYYVDTQQSEVDMTINGVPPGGSGPVPAERYVVKTLVRNGMIQHADSAAILDGWLYFCTNQLQLSPDRQYNNVDNRKGPFRSFRVWIGEDRGPAV